MSKIEDALKKAKQALSEKDTKRPDRQVGEEEGTRKPERKEEAKPLEKQVEAHPDYTRTAFQEVDAELMEENRIVTLTGKTSHITEQYRMLRTQILHKTEGNGDNCLMVTSAIDGEGKTTTAINLAVSIAREIHNTVLLVDADLRRPSIHKMLDIKPEKGLSNYLLDHVPLEDLLIRTGVEKLTFLPAGESIPNSTELLRSATMLDLIREVKERYKNRYVIFDTTPLLVTADPTVLAQYMDGIIFVVQAERTPRSDVAEALALLEGRNILGMVMNNLSEPPKTYNYDT